MRRHFTRPAPVATSLDLAVLYGIRKPRWKSRFACWCEDHLSTVMYITGSLAIIGAIWYASALWFMGVL